MHLRSLFAALVAGLSMLMSNAANAAVIGIFDGQSPANSNAIAAFLNGAGHSATNFGVGDINAANLAGLDVAILLRTNGNADLVNFVGGGGKLITEWTSFDWATTTPLIDATANGGGFVANPDSVTFTAAGLSLGLGNGLTNPYSDQGRTDFFRNAININSTILATRSSGDAAILGQAFGAGYTVGNMYDWADWSEQSTANLGRTQQMLLNMVALNVVPEPHALMLVGLGLVGLGLRRRS